MNENQSGFHSKFGGLWIDRTDTQAVARELARFEDEKTREALEFFHRWGYVVLEGAVPHEAIDTYRAQYAEAAAEPERLRINVPFGPMHEAFTPEKALIPGAKVLDTSMLLEGGDRLSFAPRITGFLNALFGGPALAFQSLHFEVGSTQTIHQDTAYVVVDQQPLQLAASWIALEDVTPGSGELIYFAGGHRMREWTYAEGASKHFNFGRDGAQAHIDHLQYLKDAAASEGFEQRSFLPKKGDVLIWHADLPHGGGAITKPGVTRRSLVTHYCPAAMTPHYFQFLPAENQEKRAAPSGQFYASMYFPPKLFFGAR